MAAVSFTDLFSRILYEGDVTHDKKELVELSESLKGRCIWPVPQLMHLLQGMASCPLPVSMMTDCY